MRKNSLDLESLIEAAQRWEITLKSAGPAEKAAFAAWIRRSPEHLQSYLQHLALQTELEKLDSRRDLSLEGLLREVPSNVISLETPAPVEPPPAHKPNRFGVLVYSACAAIVLMATLFYPWHWSTAHRVWTDYFTRTGEQSRITLDDGSVLELNTQSHVRVAFDQRGRDIQLLTGEVQFEVEYSKDQPFRVYLHQAVVEELGTQFSIHLRPDSTATVSVIQGRIKLSTLTAGADPYLENREGDSTEVIAGEAVNVNNVGKVIARSPVTDREFASWRQHRLWFENASIQEISGEFNRYNTRKIWVENTPKLANKRYTATWDPYDPVAFIEYLRRDSSLEVSSGPDWTVGLAR